MIVTAKKCEEISFANNIYFHFIKKQLRDEM